MTLDREERHRFTSQDGFYCDRCNLLERNRRHLQGGGGMDSLTCYLQGAGTLSVEFLRHTTEGRVQYRWFIDRGNDTLAGRSQGDDLMSGVGQDVNHVATMRTLVSFLLAAAEGYGYAMRQRIDLSETENGTLFDAETTEWAHQHEDALQGLALELGE